MLLFDRMWQIIKESFPSCLSSHSVIHILIQNRIARATLVLGTKLCLVMFCYQLKQLIINLVTTGRNYRILVRRGTTVTHTYICLVQPRSSKTIETMIQIVTKIVLYIFKIKNSTESTEYKGLKV